MVYASWTFFLPMYRYLVVVFILFDVKNYLSIEIHTQFLLNRLDVPPFKITIIRN